MKTIDYWKEAILCSLDECGIYLTEEHLEHVASVVERAHESYGMAFYSPPSEDRFSVMKREYEAKIKAVEARLEQYEERAETAIKRALGQHHDTPVRIGEYGEVFRTDGQTTQIQ